MKKSLYISLIVIVSLGLWGCGEDDFTPQRANINLYCNAATDITSSTAKIVYGYSGSWDGHYFSAFGIELSTSTSFGNATQLNSNDTSFQYSDSWVMTVSSLQPATRYYYRTYAVDSHNNYLYSGSGQFTTLSATNGIGSFDNYLGTYSGCCNDCNSSNSYSWTGTTITKNSDTEIFIEGFFNGKSYFCAWADWDSGRNLFVLVDGAYNSSRTYYFNSEPGVNYNARIWAENISAPSEVVEGVLIRNADGTIILTGINANSNGHIANGFGLYNRKVSDGSLSLYGRYKDLKFTPTN